MEWIEMRTPSDTFIVECEDYEECLEGEYFKYLCDDVYTGTGGLDNG